MVVDPKANGMLVLSDGKVFRGYGIGRSGYAVGEVCFNTSMTGYQEILTDPSYAGQIIAFTFPHIGNVGINQDDRESPQPQALGLVVREFPTEPSNWRSLLALEDWLGQQRLIGLCGVDTRHLTRHIRDRGAPVGAIGYGDSLDAQDLHRLALSWSGMDGAELAGDAGCRKEYTWEHELWAPSEESNDSMGCRFPDVTKCGSEKRRVVVIDYGVKYNSLRWLKSLGCQVTVVPAHAGYDEIIGHRPSGIFLSNGPGDPAATAEYAVPVIRKLLRNDLPIFGVCLGHQLLSLALGGVTAKMKFGHHGANHPVMVLSGSRKETNRIEITVQNHGFSVIPQSLPDEVEVTHVSQFDGSNEGIQLANRPVFSVQYHPEASPGPQDGCHLFGRFVEALGA